MKKYVTVIMALMFATSSWAQSSFQFEPASNAMKGKKKFMEKMELQLEEDVKAIEGGNRRDVAAAYLERHQFIVASIEEGEFIFDSPINTYVDGVMNILLSSNPQINRERINLFVSRDMVPNALCLGDGTIIVNIGLLRRLENESQLAFVLAHELSHYTQDHVNTDIAERIAYQNSAEVQREIKRIRKLKYNRNREGAAVLQSLRYSDSRHSRLNESDADAKALELILNTPYSPKEAVSGLKLLDEMDTEKYTGNLNLIKTFDRQLYPFQPEWLEEENQLSIFFGAGKDESDITLHPDSLKTHPDCLVRADRIEKALGGANGEYSIAPQGQALHDQVVALSDFESVLTAYHYQNYGLAVYMALQLQKEYPENPFLVGIVGATMGEMARAIGKKELGKILPASSPAYEEDYNAVLKFLNGLSQKNMREVAYAYVYIYRDQVGESSALAYALALTSRMKEKYDDKEGYKKTFFNKWPNGYFARKARTI